MRDLAQRQTEMRQRSEPPKIRRVSKTYKRRGPKPRVFDPSKPVYCIECGKGFMPKPDTDGMCGHCKAKAAMKREFDGIINFLKLETPGMVQR